jgi:hypothetical protein
MPVGSTCQNGLPGVSPWLGGEQDFVQNHKLEHTLPTPHLSGIHDILDEKGTVEVLLVGDGPQVFSLSRGQLESRGCRCHFARSQRELEQLLNHKQFDIVLTIHRIKGSSTGSIPLCSTRCPLKSVVGGCLS